MESKVAVLQDSLTNIEDSIPALTFTIDSLDSLLRNMPKLPSQPPPVAVYPHRPDSLLPLFKKRGLESKIIDSFVALPSKSARSILIRLDSLQFYKEQYPICLRRDSLLSQEVFQLKIKVSLKDRQIELLRKSFEMEAKALRDRDRKIKYGKWLIGIAVIGGFVLGRI